MVAKNGNRLHLAEEFIQLCRERNDLLPLCETSSRAQMGCPWAGRFDWLKLMMARCFSINCQLHKHICLECICHCSDAWDDWVRRFAAAPSINKATGQKAGSGTCFVFMYTLWRTKLVEDQRLGARSAFLSIKKVWENRKFPKPIWHPDVSNEQKIGWNASQKKICKGSWP